MPKPLQYRSGSLIYFQGDPADKIYILQTGKVSLVYQDIETKADVKDPVQPGEFFGVKSALGRYPREENAIALSETSVLVFTVPEFEAIAMANTRIIMKMLKVFSNQMRRVHRQISKVMAREEQSPADSLFNVGDFYLRNRRFSQAKYVFSRYLTFYPSGKDAAQASKNLDAAEKALTQYGNGKGPGVGLSSPAPAAPAAQASPDSAKTDKAYYDAVSLISQGKYQEAYTSLRTLAGSVTDPEQTSKIFFETGRCLFLLDKYEDCIKFFTNMLTKFPKHPDFIDTLFIMGQCNEKIGRKDQAVAFYKKLLSMGGNEENDTIKKTKRALNAIGE